MLAHFVYACRGGQSLRWVNAETGVLLADVLFADHDSGAGQLLALGQNRVAVVAGSTVGVVSSTRRAVDWKWNAEKAGQEAVLKSVDKTADGKLVAAGCLGPVSSNTCGAIAFVVLDLSSGKGELKSLNAAATPFNGDAILVSGAKVYAASAHSAAVTVLDAVTGSTSSKPTTSSVTALHVLSGKPVAKICSDKGCSLVSVGRMTLLCNVLFAIPDEPSFLGFLRRLTASPCQWCWIADRAATASR